MLSPKKTAKYFKLPENFFDDILLSADPFALRDEIFSRNKEQFPYLFETLIDAIKRDIEKILGDNPPQIDVSREFIDSTFWLSEAEFRLLSLYRKKLTHKQANAIAALRSIRSIKREYFAREHLRNDPNVAMILLETVCLIVAAIRGDFFGEYAKLIERGAAALQGSKSKKEDRLNRAILNELQLHGVDRSAIQILADIEASIPEDNAKVAEEMVWNIDDDNSVDWFDERHRTRKTKFKTLQNRISKLKKRLKP